MNRIYNIIWNQSSNQWVVASELAKAQGKTHSQSTTASSSVHNLPSNTAQKLSRMTASVATAVIATLGSSFIASQAMAAECAGAVGFYVNDSSGTTCEVSGSSYDHIQGHNPGTVINVTAPNVTVAAYGSSSYAAGVDNGAVINFAGNLDSTANGSRFAASVGYPGGNPNSTMNVAGNLTTTTDGSAESIYLFGGSLTVNGNLTATVGNNNRDVIRSFANMTVKGSTTVTSALANGMTLGGINDFGGPVTVNIAGNGKTGINFLTTPNSQFKSDVTVKTTGTSSTGIISGGTVNVAGNLNVTTTGTGASVGVNVTGGKFTANNATVSTLGAQAHGVVTSGTGSSEFAKLTVNTSGDQAFGVSATGAGATAKLGSGSTISTTGVGAHGVSVTNNANVALGSNTIITTQSDNSNGIYVKDANISASTGSVTTKGNNASAVLIDNTTGDINFGQGITLTTSGDNSHGISATVATGNVALNVGSVSTTGKDSKGVLVIANRGKANIITTDVTSQKSNGIDITGQDGVSIVSTGNIFGGGSGITAISAGGPTTIAVTGNVTGIGGAGVSGNGGGSGDTSINVNGDITAGTIGIAGSAYTGNLTIDALGNITGSQGIYASTSGGDIKIQTTSGKAITAHGSGPGSASIFFLDGIEVSAGSGNYNPSIGDFDPAGDVEIINQSAITSAKGHGINLMRALGTNSVYNSGDITANATDKFVFAGGSGIEKIMTTAGTLTGNTDLGAGDDTFTATGGTLIGNTSMGSGDDIATLTGTVDVTQAPQFDGGTGNDTLNIDGISMRGFTADTNDGSGNDITKGSNLTKWQTINVKNNGTLKLTGDIFTAEAEDPGTGGGGTRLAASALAAPATLNIDSTSTLDLKGNSPGVFTIFGDVNNSGFMTMQDGAADDVTTIVGNYTGVAGSRFAIDTVLGDDSSLTDKLVVNGNTSGTTALAVTNAGGAGAQTVEGIQVVQVDGASDGTFSLAAPVQAGSYEYTLQKNGVSTPTDGDWYLRSTFVATCANTPSLCPVDPTDPVDPVKPTPIYRPGVAAYVTAQSANADAAFLQMATLHQRMGEQRDLPTDKAQTWGRLIGGGVSSSGKNRFEYDQTTTGFQFGRDLLHKTSSIGTQQRAGVTVQYTHSSMDAKDRVRPLVGLGEDTGSMSSDSVGVGGYYTRMNQAGAYLDVVGQVNHLSNKFDDSYGGRSKQKAWQFGLSAEVGKPVADLGGWKFEPQAQLSYLLSQYDDFSDAYSNIDGLNASQLRGRLGLRVYKDMVNCDHSVQYYGVLNLHHDFLKSKAVTLHDRVGSGSALVRESFDRTFGEVGVGIQGQIKNNTYVYADARYQRSVKGNKEGAQFNIGIKTSF